MELYHRLGEASTSQEIDELLAEIKDRFGPPPSPVIWLYHLSRVRAFAAMNYFSSLKFDQLSFTAEQQKGKLITKKTILLPKKVQTPQALEEYVIAALQKEF
jgi:transcription-repair coupling factor (superfamily II helicase)